MSIKKGVKVRDTISNKKDDTITRYFEKEYEILAEAHFNVSQRVTTFFQYILLIYSAPLVLFTDRINITDTIKGGLFIIIAIIGFMIFNYVSELRLESLLYARAVNGMRRYQYDRAIDNEKDKIELSRYKVMLTQIEKPAFYDKHQFIWIVRALSVVNSAYLFSGLYFLKDFVYGEVIIGINEPLVIKLLNNSRSYFIFILLVCMLFLIIHLWSYRRSSIKQENGTEVFSHIIGVDIDGVLNDHETQFCKIFNRLHDKTITPELITTLPVRYGLPDINENEERAVFEEEEYWVDMPKLKEASVEIKRLSEALGYKIYIFTWRDWCKRKSKPIAYLKELIRYKKRPKLNEYFCSAKFNIEKLTKEWLYNNEFLYNKIFFDKGNLHYPVGHKKSRYSNRVYLSKKYKIKYFIEDDLRNALALSNICKIVFLIDHKYNYKDQLPHNIIRVKGWKEIFEYIKMLG